MLVNWNGKDRNGKMRRKQHRKGNPKTTRSIISPDSIESAECAKPTCMSNNISHFFWLYTTGFLDMH